MDGPEIAVCEETAYDSVFEIKTTFTSKDACFRHALAEAYDAFNATMLEFDFTQKLEPYSRLNTKSNRHKRIYFTDKNTITLLPHSCILFLHFFFMSSSCRKLKSTSLFYLRTTCLILHCLAGSIFFNVALLQRHHFSVLRRSSNHQSSLLRRSSQRHLSIL